jgi:hypothetical protein
MQRRMKKIIHDIEANAVEWQPAPVGMTDYKGEYGNRIRAQAKLERAPSRALTVEQPLFSLTFA